MLRLLGLLPKSVTRVNVAADAGCAATTSTIDAAIASTAAERAVRILRTRGNPFRGRERSCDDGSSPRPAGQRLSKRFGKFRGTHRSAAPPGFWQDSGMTELLLGPLLRHVDATSATIWVETGGPCEVRVGDAHARTFEV